MSVLSAQSIRRQCIKHQDEVLRNRYPPLVDPFVEHGSIRGRSFGLSACTYDCRIYHDLILKPHEAKLATTVERFCLPANVCGSVLDKSTWARMFITVFNTHLDPGWQGYLTVELVNLGKETIVFYKGDPLCQVRFEWLDVPTDQPYTGKYQNQPQLPFPAILKD